MTDTEKLAVDAFRNAASEAEPVHGDYRQMWQFALELLTFAMAHAERARLDGFQREATNWRRVCHMTYRTVFRVLVAMEESAVDMEAEFLSFVDQVEALAKCPEEAAQ